MILVLSEIKKSIQLPGTKLNYFFRQLNQICYPSSRNYNTQVVRHSIQATHCTFLSMILLSLTTISIQRPALLVHPQAPGISVWFEFSFLHPHPVQNLPKMRFL